MTPRRQWYVAVRHGRTPQGRRNWRLYTAGASGKLACPLGDYDRLRKVRAILAHGGRTVEAYRSARDQVAFWVSRALEPTP